VRRDVILAAANATAEHTPLAYALLGVWRTFLSSPEATLGTIPEVSRFNTHIHFIELYTWLQSGVLYVGALVDDSGAQLPASGLSASRLLNLRLFEPIVTEELHTCIKFSLPRVLPPCKLRL
jgi:hypothetical protein